MSIGLGIKFREICKIITKIVQCQLPNYTFYSIGENFGDKQ